MTKGAFAATEVDSVILKADEYRGEVSLQLQSGGPAFIGFGEPAVAEQGVALTEGANFMSISDHRARLAIHMICGAGSTAAGGYQTA